VTELPEPPVRIDFHLLDRQISDFDGALYGNVDDVELAVGDDGVPYVTALMVGQQVLGKRVGGLLGRWMTGSARRLQPHLDAPPIRIPLDRVAKVESGIVLSVRVDVLPTPPLEEWLDEHLIERIPGAEHASG
jgi:sporulation protein YlmC with PRC-barrel domain